MSYRKDDGYMPHPNTLSGTRQDLRWQRARLWIIKNRPLSYWVLLATALILVDAFRFTRGTIIPALQSQDEPPRGEEPKPQRPLDALMDYQILNNAPISERHAVTTKDERAVVTTMYTDDFAHGVATLGYSLQTANITARLILAYFPHKISARALCVAQAGGWELQPIERIPPPHGGKEIHASFVDQYSKLSLWSFDKLGIKSLVYLDADTLVRNNFDELFDLPYQFAAGPDVWTDDRGFVIGFNAGVMMLRTSTRIYDDLLVKMETANFPLAWAEQAFLNFYWGGHVVRLPFVYNGNVAIKERSPTLWSAMEKEMRVVHYTLAKPFPPYTGHMIEPPRLKEHLKNEKERNSRYKEELVWWEDSWKAMRAAQTTALQRCDAQHPAPPITS